MERRRSAPAAFLFALAVFATACATGPSAMQLPADTRIVPPAPSVPEELARFSGKWSGAWYGARTGAFMGDQILVVEKVNSSTATVVSAYSGSAQYQVPARTFRIEAPFNDGRLVISGATGTATYTLEDADTLSAVLKNAQGELRGTLRRMR